jgi:MFS transporter, DHA2 family, triacylglyceride efflux pump
VSALPAGDSRRRVAAAACGVAVLLAALDAYVVVTILVAIVRDLQIPINRLERATPIVTGYLLGYVAAMPLLGRLSDRVGRRPVIEVCVAGFAAGSIVSALAGSLPVLVAGRVIQGAAGGALLPVTFALVGDLWDVSGRPLPLGALGAVQEAGSVLGPLYGAGIAALVGWRGLFWINVPLAVLAVLAVRWSLPRTPGRTSTRLALPSGAILSLSLAALVVGLYNPHPDRAVLPAWGPWGLALGATGLATFAVVERRARVPLLDRTGLRRVPFTAAMSTSFLSGAILMVTLVDVPLVAETVLGKSTVGAALVLTRFLAALPVGAVLGGYLASRLGERWIAVTGLAIAAAGYWLVAGWPLDVLASRHALGPISVPRLDADLALAGIGLGLIIAPIASVALRSASASQHGVASSAVVVGRMTGMLLGIAALAAWGLHRFHQLTASLLPPLPVGLEPEEFARRLAAYERAVASALHTEYHEIFLITAAICLFAAVVSLALGSTGSAGTSDRRFRLARSG